LDAFHFRHDSPPHRTACQCRPLLDVQWSGWRAVGGSWLAELSRGAAGGTADELADLELMRQGVRLGQGDEARLTRFLA
jgi:hypothetical protein